MDWTIGVLEFDSRWGLGIVLFTTASRMALGPTQPPIQWEPGALSLGVKRPGRAAGHSPPSSAGVKECVKLHLHSPSAPSWRGAQLKKAQGQLKLYPWSNKMYPAGVSRIPFLLSLVLYPFILCPHLTAKVCISNQERIWTKFGR
jgi:hypothetical protein